jgi:hypothetical protein
MMIIGISEYQNLECQNVENPLVAAFWKLNNSTTQQYHPKPVNNQPLPGFPVAPGEGKGQNMEDLPMT